MRSGVGPWCADPPGGVRKGFLIEEQILVEESENDSGICLGPQGVLGRLMFEDGGILGTEFL